MTWNRLVGIVVGAFGAAAATISMYHAVSAPSLTMAVSGLGIALVAGLLALIIWLSPIHAEMAIGMLMLVAPYFGLFFFPVWSVVGVVSLVSGAAGIALSVHAIERRRRQVEATKAARQNDKDAAPPPPPTSPN